MHWIALTKYTLPIKLLENWSALFYFFTCPPSLPAGGRWRFGLFASALLLTPCWAGWPYANYGPENSQIKTKKCGFQEREKQTVCSKFAETRGGIDDHGTWCRGKRQKTGMYSKKSYLKTEAGLFLSLWDRRQLKEVTADNQLDASKRLGRPSHRPRIFTEINGLSCDLNHPLIYSHLLKRTELWKELNSFFN